jgi:hypothetical protein
VKYENVSPAGATQVRTQVIINGHESGGRLLAAMSLIFGDESTDETKERVFAVSALIAEPNVWDSFSDSWRQRTGGKEFHAADCEGDYGEFKVTPSNTHADNLKLYGDLAQILAKSGVRAYTAVFDLAAWLEVFPGVSKEAGYYKCFTEVLKHFLYTPEYHNGRLLEFTFDHRQESEYNAGLLYRYMVNLPEWKGQNIFMGTKLNFDSRKNVRLQAADLVAREGMKHLDNLGKRATRKSMLALTTQPGAPFKFDIFTREYALDSRSKWEEAQKATGMTPQRYLEFLNSHGLIDNWSNRFRFVAYLNAADEKNEK